MNRYDALKHAVKAHAGETDRCGEPAILHPIAVAEAIPIKSPFPEDSDATLDWAFGHGKDDAEVVALLHDVIEDTDYRGFDAGLTRAQSSALIAVSRKQGVLNPEAYAEYIERVCADPIASIVKLADLHHNLSPARQACLPAKEQASLEKRYLKARERIWKALGYEWWPEPLEDGS